MNTDQTLQSLLLGVLREQPAPMTEYELFGLLSARNQEEFCSARLKDPLLLFRAHFRLFHALYALRERLWATAEAHLEIGCLSIALRPYRPAAPALSSLDPLRDYYMDLTNLETTGAEDVEHMLGGFQARMRAESEREKALGALGLHDPVDDNAIRRRYRELVMLHHPDRGGETDRLQAINRAMASLTRGRNGTA